MGFLVQLFSGNEMIGSQQLLARSIGYGINLGLCYMY
jgi:hypothetical protein